MKPEPQWLQDYLDDRLSPAERADAERRLREDPALARELESYREVGEALRGGTEELSPGFYARARQQFERSRPAAGRRRFRLLSWEAAGLAAAAVLAISLFLPELMRRLPRESVTVPHSAPAPGRDAAAGVEPRREQPADAEKEQEPSAKPAESVDDVGRLGEAQGEAEQSAAPAQPPSAGDAEFAPVPEQRKREDDSDAPPLPGPPPEPAVALHDRVEAETGKTDAAPGARMQRTAPAAGDEMKLPSRFEETESHRAREKSAAAGVAPPTTATLPSGIVELDSFRTIDESEPWLALLEGPAGPALRTLGGYRPDHTLVLVGPREGSIDCARIRVVPGEGGYLLHLPPSTASAEGDTGGCALSLPGRGLPITLVHPPREDD